MTDMLFKHAINQKFGANPAITQSAYDRNGSELSGFPLRSARDAAWRMMLFVMLLHGALLVLDRLAGGKISGSIYVWTSILLPPSSLLPGWTLEMMTFVGMVLAWPVLALACLLPLPYGLVAYFSWLIWARLLMSVASPTIRWLPWVALVVLLQIQVLVTQSCLLFRQDSGTTGQRYASKAREIERLLGGHGVLDHSLRFGPAKLRNAAMFDNADDELGT